MTAQDIGRLLLRIVVGGLMLFHGIAKIQHGVGGIATSVDAHGLPHALTYGVYIGEVIAPLAVILGAFTRPAAAIMAFNMIVAIYLAHVPDLFHLAKGGAYALELQLLYFAAAATLAFIGGGRYGLRQD